MQPYVSVHITDHSGKCESNLSTGWIYRSFGLHTVGCALVPSNWPQVESARRYATQRDLPRFDSHSSLRELTINARILYHLVLSLWPGLVIQLNNWLADDLGLWSWPSHATAFDRAGERERESPIHYQQPSHRHRNAVSRLNNAWNLLFSSI